MNKDLEKYSDSQYENIFEKIKDSSIFGEPINLNNPKEVALAFYHYAQMESRNNFQKERDIYQAILEMRDYEK
jgi:hypothetical protein